MSKLSDQEHIDGILAPWRQIIGRDYDGYRNHVVRMSTFCLRLGKCDIEAQSKIEIAACFHDIGIWTANTLDYLPPSVPPAMEYLEKNGLAAWSDEIEQMIVGHHKLRPFETGHPPLVELFRKADLVDFSLGLVRFGLKRAEVKEVQRMLPNKGFHRALVRLASSWFIRNPLNPAPMFKW